MEHEFNIGDRVRVVDRRPENVGGNPYWVREMDNTLGKEGIIMGFGFAAGSLRVRFNDGDKWAYKPSWLVPAEAKSETAKAAPPFKPGDRVRVKPLEWFDGCRRDCAGNPIVGGITLLSPGMTACCGMEFTVERITPFGNVDLVETPFAFSVGMLEAVDAENTLVLSPLSRLGSAFFRRADPLKSGSASRSPNSADKLPLIDPTKLLTNIKLD